LRALSKDNRYLRVFNRVYREINGDSVPTASKNAPFNYEYV